MPLAWLFSAIGKQVTSPSSERAAQHHRNLAREIDTLLQHAGLFADLLERGLQFIEAMANHLSFAIVTERGGFKDCRVNEIARAIQISLAFECEKFGGVQALLAKEFFLQFTVLGNMQCCCRRVYWYRFGQVGKRDRGNIFKLGGDYCAMLGQIIECLGVIIVSG